MAKRQVELKGQEYTWTDGNWYDAKSVRAPSAMWDELNVLLAAQDLSAEAAQDLSVDETLARAKNAKSERKLALAERLVREVLRAHPQHHGAAAVLSGVLRDRGLPDEALRVTAPFVGDSYAAIFTTRAAALCDLARWEEAKREVGRALAIGGEREAFAVRNRIKKERPDLYD